jgi:hypothetical protein
MLRGPSSTRSRLSVLGMVFLVAIDVISGGICLISLLQSSHL